jgi:6-phosphofructokinase
MKLQKRLGILTSGGDCPGLNAVIRAVVSHATLTYDWQIFGIPYATQGLLEQQIIPLHMHSFDLRGIDPLLSMGGTILGTINKGNTLAQAEEIIASYAALGLDALIGIGGDGSLAILSQLALRGHWQFIAIPKTIDHDVALTERSIGFDTAVNTITDALNRLTFTASSHDRVMVVEVMGREAGHLALHSGIAGGADVILIPEISYSISAVCRHLAELRDRWKRRFAIVVVAEGIHLLNDSAPLPNQKPSCGTGQFIADAIAACSVYPVDTRVSVLGHIQRGGRFARLFH